MATDTTLSGVKLALRITVNDYDSELSDLILAAKQDLGVAGVVLPAEIDPIVRRAVITYCKMHFSSMTPAEYTHIKAAYDEQKAQLVTCTGYTNWGDVV